MMTEPIQDAHAKALRMLDSSTISDVIESFSVRDRTEGFCGAEVRCLFPQLGTMVGHAVTVQIETTIESTRPPVRSNDLWDLVFESPKPSVLVFEHVAHDIDRSCCFGGNFAKLATKLGVVGLVTNAGIRDLQEAEPLGFHYFARGAVTSHGKYHFLEIGQPVTVSGLRVNPGDLIVGDLNGVVSIPPEIDLDEVIKRANDMVTKQVELHAVMDDPRFDWNRIRPHLGLSMWEAIRRSYE